jgi:hypothetical protein
MSNATTTSSDGIPIISKDLEETEINKLNLFSHLVDIHSYVPTNERAEITFNGKKYIYKKYNGLEYYVPKLTSMCIIS